MPLSDVQVRNLKPREKPYVVRDDDGLYLEVVPGGGKYWRLRYWVEGKERKKSLGIYPAVGLREARRKRDEAKSLIANGIDISSSSETFETIAREWYQTKVLPIRSPRHSQTVISRLERLIIPEIGTKSIVEILPPDILSLLRRIESRGTYETAHRTLQIIGWIYRGK